MIEQPTLPRPDIPAPSYSSEVREKMAELQAGGLFERIAALLGPAIATAVDFLCSQVAVVAGAVLTAFVKLMDMMEGPEGVALDEFTAALLWDFLDVPVSAMEIHRARGDRGRLAAMDRIGGAFLDTLIAEFTLGERQLRGPGAAPTFAPSAAGPGEPGVTPATGMTAARRFLGFVMNFSAKQATANAVASLLPFGLLDSMGKIPEEFAANLSLGRMVRLALRPIFTTLVADPLDAALMERYRPRHLSEAVAVSAYLAGRITRQEVQDTLARLGYSDHLISVLIAEREADLSAGEIARLFRWRNISQADAVARLRGRGFSTPEAMLWLQDASLARQESLAAQLCDTLRKLVVDRRISSQQAQARISTLPYSPEEIALMREIDGYRMENDTRQLTLSQMQGAVLDGLVDLFEFQAFLQTENYGNREQQILMMDIRLRLAEEAERKKAREEADEQARQREKERRRKKEEDEKKRLAGPPPIRLTLAQITEQYVEGRISAEGLQEYLEEEGYAGRELELLLADAADEREAWVAARQRAEDLAAAAATRRITVAEMQSAYVAGLIERDEFTLRLAEVVPEERDRDIILMLADQDRRAREARDEEERRKRAIVPPPALTLSQETDLYISGYITLERLDAYLTAEGYAEEERGLLLAQAQDRRAEYERKRRDAEAAAAAVPPPKLTLGQEQQAFITGVITEDRFIGFLVAEGYSKEEQAILLAAARADLQEYLRRVAEEGTPEALAAAAAAARRQLSRTDAELAFIAGLYSAEDLRAWYTSAGYSATDAQILLSLTLRKRRDAEAREAAAREVKPRLTLTQMEAAVLQGLATTDEYAAYLEAQGYSYRERDILTTALAIKLARAGMA